MQPAYACAIIADGAGQLLLERRPLAARLAGGRHTCFGGRRQPHESALQALYRELAEELAWRPRRVGPGVDLWVDAAWIARFFVCRVEELPVPPRGGLGPRAAVLRGPALDHPQISPWHRAVLACWRCGGRRVRLD